MIYPSGVTWSPRRFQNPLRRILGLDEEDLRFFLGSELVEVEVEVVALAVETVEAE